jgi:DNA-binding transcriptional LysR family regulator
MALREAAIAGAGMAVQPEWLVGDALDAKKLVRLLPAWSIPSVAAHVVFPTGRLPRRVRAFVDYAVAQLPLLIEELTHPTFRSTEWPVPHDHPRK